jgi:hypothetical protein
MFSSVPTSFLVKQKLVNHESSNLGIYSAKSYSAKRFFHLILRFL